MRRLLVYIFFVITSCKTNDYNYTFIKENLYSDKNGAYYIKGNENDKLSKREKDIYIRTVYTGISDESIGLKNIIDTTTFKRLRNSNYYKDKNNVYYLLRVLGGGNFSVVESAKSIDFIVLKDSLEYGRSEELIFYKGEKLF